MKRILLIVIASLFCVAQTSAQQLKVNIETVKKSIERSDAMIENPKRVGKANTWIDRGNVFFKVATDFTSGLYNGQERAQVVVLYGEPTSESTAMVGGEKMELAVYPHFKIYFFGGTVYAWEQTTTVFHKPLEESYNSYVKAYDLDKKTEQKVGEGLMNVANGYKQEGQNYFNLKSFLNAAELFDKAYEVQTHPSLNIVDSATIFNAGFLYTVGQKYDEGLKALKLSYDVGYENQGDLYFYMFHCYYGMKDMANAKAILFEGIEKYPTSVQLVEGLVALYTSTNDNPQEIIEIVKKSIENDPTNIDLWSGLGRIYDKLGDPEKAIESFNTAVKINPYHFNANFNLGFLFIQRGDAMNKEFSESTPTGKTKFDETLAEINEVYAKSIEPLERALVANPTSIATIELLKNVSFRLRDDSDEMLKRFETYDAMFKEMDK